MFKQRRTEVHVRRIGFCGEYSCDASGTRHLLISQRLKVVLQPSTR